MLTRLVVDCSQVRVFSSGRAMVPYGANAPTFLSAAEMFATADEVRRSGTRTVLIVQHTRMGQFLRALNGRHQRSFEEVVKAPYVHFRSLWPNFRLPNPRAVSDRTVCRMFDLERDELARTFESCGLAGGLKAQHYWQHVTAKVSFLHPGHPAGELLATAYQPLLRSIESDLGASSTKAIRGRLRADPGLTTTFMHPIEPAYGDALGVLWHTGAGYRQWVEFARTQEADKPRFLERRDRAEIASAILAEGGPTLAACFNQQAGAAFLHARSIDKAADALAEANEHMPGNPKACRLALISGLHARRPEACERALAVHLPYLQPGSPLVAAVEPVVQRVRENRHVRESLVRVADLPQTTAWQRSWLVSAQDIRHVATG